MEGGSHSNVTPGNKLDVTTPELNLCQESSHLSENDQSIYCGCSGDLRRG
jgi:hypothetical protein